MFLRRDSTRDCHFSIVTEPSGRRYFIIELGHVHVERALEMEKFPNGSFQQLLRTRSLSCRDVSYLANAGFAFLTKLSPGKTGVTDRLITLHDETLCRVAKIAKTRWLTGHLRAADLTNVDAICNDFLRLLLSSRIGVVAGAVVSAIRVSS